MENKTPTGFCHRHLFAIMIVKWAVIMGVIVYLDGKNRIERHEIRNAITALSDQLKVRPADVYERIEQLELKLAKTPSDVLNRVEILEQRLIDNAGKIHQLETERAR